ncbi:arsenate reductase family protein [Phaeobacter sp.]|uniref:arsenate reductase family protein n=1 Tax=Phaeobacter sp. TaxID=1902409 RepID=UPI0025DD0D76|nr:arsenate reductase family protein [Phaeobacter sp.]
MITYWHNPRCSKSRAGLQILEEHSADHKVRLYLDDNPTGEEIRQVQQRSGLPITDLLRPCEPVFAELGLALSDPEDVLIAAMAAHPILIQRPIAITGTAAVIGRPPEQVKRLL